MPSAPHNTNGNIRALRDNSQWETDGAGAGEVDEVQHTELLCIWRYALLRYGADYDRYGDRIGYVPSAIHFIEQPRVKSAARLFDHICDKRRQRRSPDVREAVC